MSVRPAARLVVGRRLLTWGMLATLTGCASGQVPSQSRPAVVDKRRPRRFRIVPDDYHVPYAGTAGDGRRFFLSEELFSGDSSYVGLFLWHADGSFDEVRVDRVDRPGGLPAGQAAPAGAKTLVRSRLAELGHYVLGAIEVEPFAQEVDGVTFGWDVGQNDDGSWYVDIEPGDFIAYFSPWDGEYDT